MHAPCPSRAGPSGRTAHSPPPGHTAQPGPSRPGHAAAPDALTPLQQWQEAELRCRTLSRAFYQAVAAGAPVSEAQREEVQRASEAAHAALEQYLAEVRART